MSPRRLTGLRVGLRISRPHSSRAIKVTMNTMSHDAHVGRSPAGWREAIGFPHILRTLSIAAQPAKIGLAFLAIAGTFFWGWLLDAAWSPVARVDETAIAAFVAAREEGIAYAEPEGDLGIFEAFRRHERRAILGFLGSVIPGRPVPLAAPGEELFAGRHYAGPLRNLVGMVHGVLWMGRVHPVYFILFAGGMLLLWSLLGGAICRLAALQFARDEQPTARQGLEYGRKKWIGGFLVAPCFPLGFAAIVLLVVALGGVVLLIPAIGDLLAGILFFLALLGGFFAALLLVGFLVGGSLFWPAVAVEGADGFDSFSRGMAYAMSRPLRSVVYAVLLILYAAVCWILLRVFAYLGLSLTHAAAGWGTTLFGMTGRDAAGRTKLDAIWPMDGPGVLWAAPNWEALSRVEYISAGLIAFWMFIVIGLIWAFLCSFYFSGSTVAYFLLRRDVDLIDLDEIYTEETEANGSTSIRATSSVSESDVAQAGDTMTAE